MRGRFLGLSVTLVAMLSQPSQALAHRLMAEVHVLPGRQIQVESWFENDGRSPAGADVRVFRSNGTLFTQGKLDAQGIFAFTFNQPVERLNIVVSAGQGHLKELTVTVEDLEQLPDGFPGRMPHGIPSGVPLASRQKPYPLDFILVGVGFLLALAAFLLSVRNARRLERIEQALGLILPPEKLPPGAPPTDPDRR